MATMTYVLNQPPYKVTGTTSAGRGYMTFDLNPPVAFYTRTREDAMRGFTSGNGNLPTLGEKYGAAIVWTNDGVSHVPVT